ncbi:MAG: ATP-binding protein [Myxococcota bacterium]|nr:ATP-binding protein [Myxococcota bacterium]
MSRDALERDALERENRILRKKLERTKKNLREMEDYRERTQGFLRQLITEFQANEIRLQESEHAAQQASQAKSKFLATMSHELRTPLNAILAYSDLLVDEPILAKEPAVLQDVREIKRAGHHLLGLIESILNLSRIETGQLDLACETASTRELLTGVGQFIEPLASRKNNKLFIQHCKPDLTIHVDRLRLRQILLNLLGNAIKFTKNGNILLKIQRSGADRIQFIVEDNGIGIPPGEQLYIFEAFYQVRESGDTDGVGLGLSVSAQLCQRMGGSITVASNLGEGTRFVVELPISCDGHA